MKNNRKKINIRKKYLIDTTLDDYYTNPYFYISKDSNQNTYKTSDSAELAKIINELTNTIISNNKKNKEVKKTNEKNFDPIIFKHIANNNIVQLEKIIKTDKNLNINQQDKDGDTPLHISVFLGNVKAIKILLENNADPLIIDKWGQTPLHRICFCIGDTKAVDIIDIFFQKDKIEGLDLFNTQDNHGNTVFHLVLKHIIKKNKLLNINHKNIIDKLNKLTNPNLKNKDSQTIDDLINLIMV
jgi:hypothetical protein